MDQTEKLKEFKRLQINYWREIEKDNLAVIEAIENRGTTFKGWVDGHGLEDETAEFLTLAKEHAADAANYISELEAELAAL